LQNRPTLRRSKTLPATHTPVKEKALLCTPLKEKKTLATQERIFGNDKLKGKYADLWRDGRRANADSLRE
ncbi:MAG TPA: hypothetical protein VN612_11510, partial [Acidobacteriaceae bacterium]|nr:hypothetical protein [Acidobacteriaceae bacterium]